MGPRIEVLRRLYRGRWAGKSGQTAPVELEEQARQLLAGLRESGIVVMHEYFTEVEMHKIRSLMDSRLAEVTDAQWEDILVKVKEPGNRFGIAQPDGARLWSDKNRSDQRICGLELISPEAKDFATDELLLNISKAYLDREVSLAFCMANRTNFVESNLGSGGGWHRDMNYKRGFKALVYLVDTDETNGCFQYLPKSSSPLHPVLKTPIPDKYQFGAPALIAVLQAKLAVLVLHEFDEHVGGLAVVVGCSGSRRSH